MEQVLRRDLKRRVMRCIVEFRMLKSYDRVLIGLSGGKDSLFLLHIFKELRNELPFSIDVAALSVDLGFEASDSAIEMNFMSYCRDLGIEHLFVKTRIAEHIDKDNPCNNCSYFRRAVMNRIAAENGYNKIALGHHLDDAVETFLLNLFFTGELKTMSPITYQDRAGITIIRPLLYLREKEIDKYMSILGVEPMKTPCPYAQNTRRADVKKLLNRGFNGIDDIVPIIASAMREKPGGNYLWPSELSKDEVWELFKAFWGKEMDS